MQQTVLLSDVREFADIRSLKEHGVLRIQEKISRLGFLPNFPVLITPINGHYKLIDGHHRYEAAKRLGLTEISALIKENLSEEELETLAFKSNEASETAVPMTFVDHAEWIWKHTYDKKKNPEGYTQEKMGEVLGWSRGKVSQHAMLENISRLAWDIVATEIEEGRSNSKNEGVAENATGVAPIFTENLLRDILSLKPQRQYDLVWKLANGKITKKDFKHEAATGKAREDIFWYCRKQLGKLKLKFVRRYYKAAFSGNYDKEWAARKYFTQEPGTVNPKSIPKLATLIKAIRDEQGIVLLHGDCLDVLKTQVKDESVDLLVLDPPYYKVKDDEWDNQWETEEEYLDWCDQWLQESDRILKKGGAIYVFGYWQMLRKLSVLMDNYFTAHSFISWDTVQGTGGGLWVNRQEHILYYSKGDPKTENKEAIKLERAEQHVREYKGKEYRFKNPSNVWRIPCVDNQHPDRTEISTQKPVELIERIVKASSCEGEQIVDFFAGSGTTLIACRNLQRGCLGVEKSKVNFDIAKKRCEL